jgi:hypothetical protein
MIIAQISDTHAALDSPDADQRIRDFERTIADINALDPVPLEGNLIRRDWFRFYDELPVPSENDIRAYL